MKPVLPKLQEFGEDRDEQVDRVGGGSVGSQRAKRGRVKRIVLYSCSDSLASYTLIASLY